MGHMHLSQRLEQLNRQLQFEPGKSGLKLMDDIDKTNASALVFYTTTILPPE
jgi:hypothetical protein